MEPGIGPAHTIVGRGGADWRLDRLRPPGFDFRRYRDDSVPSIAARRRGELRVRHRFGGDATPLQYLLDLTKYFAGISANAALTSEAASALQSLLSCAGRV